MTVQELIDKLSTVKDKSKRVATIETIRTSTGTTDRYCIVEDVEIIAELVNDGALLQLKGDDLNDELIMKS